MTVYGQAAGAGSKSPMPLGGWAGKGPGRRFVPALHPDGRPRFYVKPSSEKTKPWMELVEYESRTAWRGRPTLDGPLWVDIDFYEKRPEGHFFADGRLKPDAPTYPSVTTTHDSGKLRRAIEDALTNAKLWADDKRVVDGHDRKHYCDAEHRDPRAIIRVGIMAAPTVGEAVAAGILQPPTPAEQTALI